MDIKKITEQEVNDLISKEKIDLSSFEVRSTLNPKIYDVDQHMHEEIRRRLLMIADDFFETLKVEWVDIQDIILTGSLANYNWSKFSDVDLHILIDFEDVDENIELVKEYFTSKKNLWNENHDITIKSYDVELYVQETKEPHVSSGVYSVLWDGWVIKPDSSKKEIDSKKVEQKVNSIVDTIEEIYFMYKSGEYDKTIRMIKNLKDKIKKMRQTGLDREGEYSYENISFKVLRRTMYLDKLSEIESKAYDKSLTLDESLNNNKFKL
jgi:predicted nucleotidyltransferase